MFSKITRLLRPSVIPCMAPIQNVKTVVKLNKERFQIILNVKGFTKDEIKVKARDEFVHIEGKTETNTCDAFVVRQFVKKIRLPKGCFAEDVTSTITSDGILTVDAKREGCGTNYPCERLVPIKLIDPIQPVAGDSAVYNCTKDQGPKKCR